MEGALTKEGFEHEHETGSSSDSERHTIEGGKTFKTYNKELLVLRLVSAHSK
jgi:hypothetical protein